LRLSWWGFLKRLYQEYEDNEVGDSAAAISYYLIFSLFPFLFFLATLVAYIPSARASTDTLLERARAFLPSEAMGIVKTHLRELVDRPRPQLLTFGLAAAVYSASCGVDALRKGLNLAYDVKESRPLWKTSLLALGMTVGVGLLALAGIALLVAGGSVGLWAARYLHIADEYVIVLRWIRWPIVAVMVTFGAALSYYVLPDVEQKFKFITPGSVTGTLVWFLTSWAFDTYVSHFGSYNVAYGSIGGVIVLLTWFFITGFILLMGGEMNAIIEQSTSDGKQAGAHAPNQAPPPPDQRPSAVPPGATKSADVAERSRGGKQPPKTAPRSDKE
jgi:Predicted membrane protein